MMVVLEAVFKFHQVYEFSTTSSAISLKKMVVSNFFLF